MTLPPSFRVLFQEVWSSEMAMAPVQLEFSLALNFDVAGETLGCRKQRHLKSTAQRSINIAAINSATA